jgi:hypothetical protein
LQAHEAAIGGFVQAIVPQQVLGCLYGCLVAALVFLEMKEGLASLKKELLLALTLGFQPFLIPAGEKGALIEVYGRLPVGDSTGGGYVRTIVLLCYHTQFQGCHLALPNSPV